MTVDQIRVLIVDDDDRARRLHASYLAELDGFILVDAVGSGEAAIAVASRPGVDLVLLDINLPGFSGVEVLHKLREARGGAVDVWIVSAARDRQTVRQVIAARIVGFLVKPFTREVFAQRLLSYRSGRMTADRTVQEADIPLGQGEIDELVAMLGRTVPGRKTPDPSERVPDTLPAGIAAPTLTAMRAALDPWQPATASEIADRTGASRATARRYLDHLVHCGEVDVSHRFGRRGRPEVLYRLAILPE